MTTTTTMISGGTLPKEYEDLRDTVADAPRYTGGQALTHGETRVLHYLPTNLSAREIAGELYLSVNTIKTHQRHLYAKLGARSRTQAVEQARALGLLAPSFRGRPATSGSATSGDGLVRTLEPRTVRRDLKIFRPNGPWWHLPRPPGAAQPGRE